MNPLLPKLIRQNVLEALKFAQGYPILEAALRSHVASLVRPGPTDEQWAENLAWLTENDAIAPVEASFDKTLVQYTITEKGRALLATL